MGKIWIAGTGFDIDAKVVRWDEGPGFDATQPRCVNPSQVCGDGIRPFSPKAKNFGAKRYSTRPALRRYGENPPLAAAQAVLKQFILHHDGCPTAQSCFNVLHNERGLSCHLLLDNDGTIYQTMDLSLMAYHAAQFNTSAIGIELCNRGDAKTDPNYYRSKGQKRDVVTCRIHGHTYLCFDYTEPQMTAMKALAKGLARALPNLPLEYPQDTPGHQAWAEIKSPRSFAGYMGHYHTTRRKWDPGPFDFKGFCEKVRGSMCFPVYTKTPKEKNAIARPEVPSDADELRKLTDDYYRANEQLADGGYFPVGPFGDSRLWHGGVHLMGKAGGPVFAPFPGRLVAARMGGTSAVGSTNFVLLRHDMTVGEYSLRFFSLYFHLQDEWNSDGNDGGPEWLATESWQKDKGRGKVVLLDEPIEAGAQIGRIGMAGPPGSEAAQIHFEIFSASDIVSDVQQTGIAANIWTLEDGSGGGRFSDIERINAPIDTDQDKKLSRRELLDFFSGASDRTLMRFVATLNLSEWTYEPDWKEALKLAPDFQDIDQKKLTELIDDQITPGLWWDDRVAKHAKLPRDGMVFHYHPISFLKFINEKLLEATLLADTGRNAFKASEAKAPPAGVTDDIGDESGESFVDESELIEEDQGEDLPIQVLVEGFPE